MELIKRHFRLIAKRNTYKGNWISLNASISFDNGFCTGFILVAFGYYLESSISSEKNAKYNDALRSDLEMTASRIESKLLSKYLGDLN